MKIREVITISGWTYGNGFNYETTYKDDIIDLSLEEINDIKSYTDDDYFRCVFEWEKSELPEGEDLKIRVDFFYANSNDEDNEDNMSPFATFETWESKME